MNDNTSNADHCSLEVLAVSLLKFSIISMPYSGILTSWSFGYGRGGFGIGRKKGYRYSIIIQEEGGALYCTKTKGNMTSVDIIQCSIIKLWAAWWSNFFFFLILSTGRLENIWKLGRFPWENDDGYGFWP